MSELPDQTRLTDKKNPRPFRMRGFFLPAVFVLWAVAISLPLGLFSAAHQAVLPVAQDSLAKIGDGSGGDSWRLIHVLSEDCPCSLSVLDYLLERGSSPLYSEEVVLIDANEESLASLRAAGFEASSAGSELLCSNFGSEGVPFFQVVEGSAKPAYSGAYFDSAFRGTSGFLDLKTAARLSDGGFVFSRPVYGCATSDRLKAVLDPFGLK